MFWDFQGPLFPGECLKLYGLSKCTSLPVTRPFGDVHRLFYCWIFASLQYRYLVVLWIEPFKFCEGRWAPSLRREAEAATIPSPVLPEALRAKGAMPRGPGFLHQNRWEILTIEPCCPHEKSIGFDYLAHSNVINVTVFPIYQRWHKPCSIAGSQWVYHTEASQPWPTSTACANQHTRMKADMRTWKGIHSSGRSQGKKQKSDGQNINKRTWAAKLHAIGFVLR